MSNNSQTPSEPPSHRRRCRAAPASVTRSLVLAASCLAAAAVMGANSVVAFSSARLPAAPSCVRRSCPTNPLSASRGEFDAEEDPDLARKNLSRKKFGLPPLTPAEYSALMAEVRALEVSQAERAEEMARSRAAREGAVKEDREGGIVAPLARVLQSALRDTCQGNEDCDRPLVCCDLGFKKMCCASGKGIFEPQLGLEGRMKLVPVPAAVANPPSEQL